MYVNSHEWVDDICIYYTIFQKESQQSKPFVIGSIYTMSIMRLWFILQMNREFDYFVFIGSVSIAGKSLKTRQSIVGVDV